MRSWSACAPKASAAKNGGKLRLIVGARPQALRLLVGECAAGRTGAHQLRCVDASHTSNASKTVLARAAVPAGSSPLGGHVAGPTVTLVHATPTSNLVYVTEDRTCGFLAKMADSAGLKAGDVICFGHTHQPWHRTVGGVHFVNTGSVGRPKGRRRPGGVRGAPLSMPVMCTWSSCAWSTTWRRHGAIRRGMVCEVSRTGGGRQFLQPRGKDAKGRETRGNGWAFVS